MITGERRLRHWTLEEKAAILAESCQPGASVSEIARRHGLNRNLLGTWRRQLKARLGGGRPAFVPIRIMEEPAALPPSAPAERQEGMTPAAPERHGEIEPVPVAGNIEIEIGGARVRISGAVDATALRQVLTHLRHRP